MQHHSIGEAERRFVIKSLNTLHGLRKKAGRIGDSRPLGRGLEAMERLFSKGWIDPAIGFEMSDPTGEDYSETRSDCDASIAGDSVDDLVIVDTLKPIIRVVAKYGDGQSSMVIQKGAVVVRSKTELEAHNG